MAELFIIAKGVIGYLLTYEELLQFCFFSLSLALFFFFLKLNFNGTSANNTVPQAVPSM